jgi:hypothetical protein
MLVYFMTIWNILWPFVLIYGRLVYVVCGVIFLPFWYVWTKKNLATLSQRPFLGLDCSNFWDPSLPTQTIS